MRRKETSVTTTRALRAFALPAAIVRRAGSPIE
jgi:hypothetical protein